MEIVQNFLGSAAAPKFVLFVPGLYLNDNYFVSVINCVRFVMKDTVRLLIAISGN